MKRTLFIIILLVSICSSWAQINKPYFYQRGRELIIENRYREAIESLNILLRNQPDDHEGFFLRGVAKYNLDDLGGAAADFSSAIEIYQSYTAAYQYRAITRSRMGQYGDAIADFERAIEIRPSMPGLYYSRGVTLFLNQQFARSITDFDQFLRLAPLEPSGYINRGTSYLYLKDTVSAFNNYNRAIEVNPYLPEGYMRRGMLYIMQGKYLESLPDLDKTIEISPESAIGYFYRAMAFSNLDKIMLALDDFDSSVDRDSTNAVTLFNRAILRSQIGDYNRAIDDYDRVARTNSGNVLVFFNRATLHVQIGNYDQAIADYSRAIELYPDFANAYIYRSQLRAAMGDSRGSRKDMSIAQAKIAAYRSKLSDTSFSEYADTSKQFNKIISLDADFGNSDFSKISESAQRDLKILPLFRLGLVDKARSLTRDPNRYQNQRIEEFIVMIKEFNIDFTNTTTARYTPDTIKLIDSRIDQHSKEWSSLFAKGITQSLLSQYTSAMSYYDFAVSERPNNPFVYLNRAATRTEMIDFVASLDGDYQNITIDSDPAVRLKKAERRTYDYSQAIADTQQAIALMPELPYSYYNLGNLMVNSGNLPRAIEYYTQAIVRNPYFAEAYYNRGLVQIYVKDNKSGCLDLSKAGELGMSQAYEILKKYCIK